MHSCTLTPSSCNGVVSLSYSIYIYTHTYTHTYPIELQCCSVLVIFELVALSTWHLNDDRHDPRKRAVSMGSDCAVFGVCRLPVCMYVCGYVCLSLYVSELSAWGATVRYFACADCLYVCVYVCMYVCMYVCRLPLRMYVCVYVCVCQ